MNELNKELFNFNNTGYYLIRHTRNKRGKNIQVVDLAQIKLVCDADAQYRFLKF